MNPIKIIYKRLGYIQVEEMPDIGDYSLAFTLAFARLVKLNGAEWVHITR